jgi:hypothetical protein
VKKNKVYIYLARRDKKGIKILTCFNNSNTYHPTRIHDLKQLKLPDNLYNSLNKEIVDNKMLYEPWIQSSDSFENLKKSLLKRGYSNLPFQKSVIYTIKEKENNLKLKINNKTMLRKKSDK